MANATTEAERTLEAERVLAAMTDADRTLCMLRSFDWHVHDAATIAPGLTQDRATWRCTFHIVRGGPSYLFCSSRLCTTVGELRAVLDPFFVARGIVLSDIDLQRSDAQTGSLTLTFHAPSLTPEDEKHATLDRAAVCAKLRRSCDLAGARALLQHMRTTFPEHADQPKWKAAGAAPGAQQVFEAIESSLTDYAVARRVECFLAESNVNE